MVWMDCDFLVISISNVSNKSFTLTTCDSLTVVEYRFEFREVHLTAELHVLSSRKYRKGVKN